MCSGSSSISRLGRAGPDLLRQGPLDAPRRAFRGWAAGSSARQQAGGGPLIDLGVHVLDMALYLMGEPQPLAVSASTYAEFGPRGLKGRHGPRCSSAGGAALRGRGPGDGVHPPGWRRRRCCSKRAGPRTAPPSDDFGVTLYGSEGGVELLVRNYTYENTVRVFTDVGGVPTDLAPRIRRGEGPPGVIARFVEAILRRGAPPMPSAADGLRRAEMIAACTSRRRRGTKCRFYPAWQAANNPRSDVNL